jgi:hypothetical protein
MRFNRLVAWIVVVGTLSAVGTRASRSAHAADSCNVAGDVQQVSKTLSKVGQAGLAASPSCNSVVESPPARAARVECPAFLKSAYVTNDRYRGFLEESASDSCRVYLKRANAASVAEVERRLSKNSASSLGAPDRFLEKCLETSVSVQHWQITSPPSMPGAPIRPWTKTTEESLGDNEKKALTAEYYLSMNRLRTGSQASLETVAAIDSTLGQKPLADRRCDDSRLPGIDDTCRRLQACAPTNALAAQAAELDQILPLWLQLKAKKSEGEATRGLSYLGQAYGGNAAQSNAARAEADAAIGEASKQLQVLQSMYPALEGKEFQKAFDPKKKNTEEALRKQLEATRARVVERLDSYRKGMDCLNSPFSCSKECEEYPKALAQAPEFRVEAFKSGESATSDDLDVQSYLGAAECRQGVRGAQKEAGEITQDLAIGAGLTIATGGIGTIAAGAKAATTFAQTARATGAMGRVAEILAKPLFEVSVSARTAAFARATILGGDLLFAANGVNTAIDQCSEALNQLSPGSSAGLGSACPGAEDSKQVQIMADYRACVLSAALSVGPNLLPVVPAFVKAYRSGARRIAAAKPAVERLEKAKLLESIAPGRYQAVMKSGEPVEIIVEKTRDGSQQVRALSKGKEVGDLRTVYDLQSGKYSVTWVEVADSVGGKSYRGEGLNSLMVDASLKELGGAEKFGSMVGLLTTENSKSFHSAKRALLDGSGEFSFEKNPRLKAYHDLRARALSEKRDLTEAELKSFSKEVDLDAALNRKVFSESTAAGKMRADRGFEPVEVEVVNSRGRQPVRYVTARKPAAKVVEEPTAKVVEKPAAKVVEEPTAKVVEEPTAKVVEKPAALPLARPASQPIPRLPKAKVSESWFPESHSEEKIIARPREPLSTRGVLLKTLDSSGCADCPESIRVGSTMSHAKQHFWDHKPPRSGETTEQWMARRVAADGRGHITSVFPPGVSQNQILVRAQSAKLKAVSQGSDAVIRGKIALEYVDSSSKVREGLFDVKIVICRKNCAPSEPGDVISIFPISGPGVIKYDPRTKSLVR